jgi:hypothetical protein
MRIVFSATNTAKVKTSYIFSFKDYGQNSFELDKRSPDATKIVIRPCSKKMLLKTSLKKQWLFIMIKQMIELLYELKRLSAFNNLSCL